MIYPVIVQPLPAARLRSVVLETVLVEPGDDDAGIVRMTFVLTFTVTIGLP